MGIVREPSHLAHREILRSMTRYSLERSWLIVREIHTNNVTEAKPPCTHLLTLHSNEIIDNATSPYIDKEMLLCVKLI